MTTDHAARPDVDMVLDQLKDFQRDTVDYVFRRLYTDKDAVSRFLVADEVGLGKTLVARGLIAKVVDYLWDRKSRINVVYICSNQDIARQNIDRLNIPATREFQFASRATLLPVVLQELRDNKLNFVSLTPGTSFNLRSQGGWQRERAVLYALLRRHWDVPEGTLRNTLRGNVQQENWLAYTKWFERDIAPILDTELRQAFYKALDAAPNIREQYEQVAAQVGGRRKHLTWEMRHSRNQLVGDLRHLLARSSLAALEPDLVILDEFQRFKYLLDETGDIALLAQELFDFQDVKVLLLSATPYKMYTVQGEEGENHYEDFYRTVKFLLNGQTESTAQLEVAIARYRNAMFHLDTGGREELRASKAIIEGILRKVMTRSERLAASVDRNGMLVESCVAQDLVRPADLIGFMYLDRIAQTLGADDQVEYWKSAAYPLNLMDDYVLKRKFKTALSSDETLPTLLREAQSYLLNWETIQTYEAIDPGNARLRALLQDSIETGNWQLLWMPPALPYYQLAGPFCQVAPQGCTKTLVFSSWKLVPKMLAILLSYEAERQMLATSERDFAYSELTEKRRPLLNFALSRERLTGMMLFCLMYPCLALARQIDPLSISKSFMDGKLPSGEDIFNAAREKVKRLLARATRGMPIKRSGRRDERWYWVALALLDRHFERPNVQAWLSTADTSLAWERMLDRTVDDNPGTDDAGEARHFMEHVAAFRALFEDLDSEPLGRRPDDLLDVLTYIALGSPAVVALRALLRIVHVESGLVQPPFLASAARMGVAFRVLFNQPEATVLLQQWHERQPYWYKVLRYGYDGNLQAVMDEYLHILYESLGLVGHDPAECVIKLSQTVHQALTIRAPTLRFDEIVLPIRPPTVERGMRCRYALRFGDEKSADGQQTRGVDVRVAFNSPFRPFVLATTSVGQEGLDFHQYCHRVVHWNLPSNPVDLEQREGRVHRYKGHVIRRNLASHYGLSGVHTNGELIDPWQQLFDQAVEDRPDYANDMVPFWIYDVEREASDGPAFKIERKVPILPLSREIGRLGQLKRSLVVYRSVIGQPRQQELLEFLVEHLDADDIPAFVQDVAIDLSPPHNLRNES